MNEPAIPLSALAAWGMWTLTTVLLLTGWMFYVAGMTEVAIMLATSACVTGLGASTFTSRCYARHVSRLIRLSAQLGDDAAVVNQVRPIR